MTECRQETPEVTINVAGAHAKHTLMQWSSSGQNYVVATADPSIGNKIAGHLTKATQEAGKATIRLLSCEGTAIGIASGAISEGDNVTAAASGAVEANGAGVLLGVAMETVTSGEAVEYRPFSKKAAAGGEAVVIGNSTAAAGSTTSDAGVLPAATGRVYPTTAADGTKGVRVHASDKVQGRMIHVGNGVSNAVLKVYPPSGGSINGAAADAAFSSVSGKGVTLICLNSTSNTWFGF